MMSGLERAERPLIEQPVAHGVEDFVRELKPRETGRWDVLQIGSLILMYSMKVCSERSAVR